MAIFNTLLLNCFLLPLFNPPDRYLGLPSPFPQSLAPIPYHLPWAEDKYNLTCIHTYIRTYIHTYSSRPEVATCKLDTGAKHLSVSSCAGPPVLKIHLSSDTCTSRPQPAHPSPHPATLSYYPFRHNPPVRSSVTLALAPSTCSTLTHDLVTLRHLVSYKRIHICLPSHPACYWSYSSIYNPTPLPTHSDH